MQREEINLADRAEIGADLWSQSRWQSHLRKSLQDLLAIPIVLRVVVENQHQAGKAEEGSGAQMFQMRNPIHRDLERNGDLLLHLLRGNAGPLSDYLNVVIGDIRVSLDRKVAEGNDTPDEQERSDRQ